MKKTRRKIFNRIASALDFPSDIYTGGFRIEMYSECEACIWGVKGIYDYCCDRVELVYKKGKIVFSGASLKCDSYMDGIVWVRGEISQITLERG